MLSDKVDITRRVFIWLAFYTGMREGEICGRCWRDWNRDSRPLGALLCSSQNDDRPLKGDEEGGDARPRMIPVHPELAKVLNEWRPTGFEIVHGRRPDDDDFIVPIRSGAGTNLTRSSAYKLWRKACDEAGLAQIGAGFWLPPALRTGITRFGIATDTYVSLVNMLLTWWRQPAASEGAAG